MSENAKIEAQKERVLTALNRMFELLGLEGTIRVEERNQHLAVKIASPDAGRIIGRKGQTLESLQLLVNRIMFKDDEEFPRVTIDIDGYASGDREPREGRRERRFDGDSERESGSFRRRSSRRFSDDGDEGGEHFSRSQLEQRALDAAKEVKRWGEPIKMPEMNAHDRRIIHLALQDDPEISTESEGEGAMKKVVISLKKSE